MEWLTAQKKWLIEQKEFWQPSPGGCRAFLVSIIFLALGFSTILIFQKLLKLQQDAVLVAILLVPVVIYLILSGKLLEFKAGGISAKFNATAKEPVSKGEINAKPLEVQQVAVIEKGTIADLQRYLKSISNTMYIVLTVTFGKGPNYYSADALLKYLRTFSQYRDYILLAILDQNGKVYAYLTSQRAMQIIEKEMPEDQVPRQVTSLDKNRFVRAINEGKKTVLSGYELVKTTLRATDTNISALNQMTRLNMDALIVTDENGKLKGVVEREQVLSRLLLAMTK